MLSSIGFIEQENWMYARTREEEFSDSLEKKPKPISIEDAEIMLDSQPMDDDDRVISLEEYNKEWIYAYDE